MRLDKATIANFRSIEDFQLHFTHGTQILIGINESGKSNILRALQLIDPNKKPSQADVRIERRDEEPITKGFVRFEFELDPSERQQVFQAVAKNLHPDSLAAPIVMCGSEALTLREFCDRRCSCLYEVNVLTGERRATYWSLPTGLYKMAPGWKKSKLGQDLTILSTRNIESVLKNAQIYQSDLVKTVEGLVSDTITVDDLNQSIGTQLIALVNSHLPQCVYWRYSDEFLLPSSVDIDAFSSNPESCIPLKSMFELAGYPSPIIGSTISAARSQAPHRYLNLLARVSNAATNHLHSVWPEHKNVKLELRPNGSTIIPVIQDDQIPLDMANRSDGFKRLVSFLLQVSAKVKMDQIRNTLILVDEPEIALHPRGARSLMQELIQIGSANTVVYSTHSIFMVDRDCIDRHIIVEKKNEKTITWRADKSRVQDEDVLYGAIGYSIFETVKKKNIIFEGWRDKELFRVAADSAIRQHKLSKEQVGEVGLTFAEGVKDVKHVTKFLQLADRNCLIISDADPAGVSAQREHVRSNGWGKWITLQDVYGGGAVVSSEDLLERNALLKRANLFRKQHRPDLSELTAGDFKAGVSTIKSLENWIRPLGLSPDESKELLHHLKGSLFEKLRRDEIVDSAFMLVEHALAHDYAP